MPKKYYTSPSIRTSPTPSHRALPIPQFISPPARHLSLLQISQAAPSSCTDYVIAMCMCIRVPQIRLLHSALHDIRLSKRDADAFSRGKNLSVGKQGTHHHSHRPLLSPTLVARRDIWTRRLLEFGAGLAWKGQERTQMTRMVAVGVTNVWGSTCNLHGLYVDYGHSSHTSTHGTRTCMPIFRERRCRQTPSLPGCRHQRPAERRPQ